MTRQKQTQEIAFEEVVERGCGLNVHKKEIVATVSGTGMDVTSINELLAEIGVDMEVFPTAGHLTSWAGLAPGNNESAGKKAHTPTTATKQPKRQNVRGVRHGPKEPTSRPDTRGLQPAEERNARWSRLPQRC